MGKRLTTEYVRGKVEERGWIMRSEVYVNAHIKLDLVCPNGHEHSVSWNNFQQYCVCPECVKDKNRHDIFNVMKKEFKKRGWELKSKEFVGSFSLLEYICERGHVGVITWDAFKRRASCFECFKEDQSVRFRQDMGYIAESFETRGYVLESGVYINNKIKLNYTCPRGHKGSMTWNRFQQGTNCPICHWEDHLGENSPGWKGGISCDPYCGIWKDKEYKEALKQRDGYRCQNPYCSCNGGLLCLHHIDFNKKNCCPSNLITVCLSCNCFANHDREWHIAWYQTLMNKKYGYVY